MTPALHKIWCDEDEHYTFWNDSISDCRCVISDAFATYTEWWNAAPHRPKDCHVR